MKRIIALISILIYIIALQGCASKNEHTTELSEYGSWKESTASMLANSFVCSLPDNEIVNKYGKEYYYKSSQGTLGDQNFVICVALQFADKASYENELRKYTTLLSDSLFQNDTTYYMIQYSNEAVTEYTNDKIYDGMFFNFEIISTNSNSYTICFLNAHIWDYYKDKVLIDYLQLINTKAS